MEAIKTEPTVSRPTPTGGAIALALAPGLALLAIGTVLSVDNGGFATTVWYPAALIVLALAAVVLAAAPPRPSEAWLGVRGALIAFAGYTAWSYLSILWAEVPAKAWDGANRDLLYLLVFALVTLRPWSARAGRIALGVVVFVIAGVGIGELIATAVRSNPSSLFLDGRLAAPTGYSNATPALWLMGGLPGLWLACDKTLPALLRAAFAAVGTMLVELALLSQSRGSVLALFVGIVVLLSFAQRRWPALIALGTALAATAVSWSPLTAVHSATRAGLPAALHDARVAIVISTVVVFALAAVAALLDDRIGKRLGPDATRRGNRALLGLLAIGIVAGLISMGNPSTWVNDRWQDFKKNQPATGATRFNGSLGSQRYDVYRVGIDDFLDHPIQGLGVDSFGPSYLVRGHTTDQPHYAHSMVISLLAETGIVGTALFLAFLLLAGRAATRAIRSRRGVAAVGGLIGFAVFVGGALVDWLWQFPG
ncbi:MAG: hypothetical protein QOG68_2062, partial [Solirubrobacteraceae bacterium]|nr:hypothetical protein [Solirubrobacteraceae bacterium]